MLSAEENEMITRVGPGTPMGEYMRRYWHPALLSREIPEPDSPPARLRLLGEDLIAFRDTKGRVGVLEAHCPHRGAPLFYGRNEECGLRCLYHGWKFDTDGNCVDMPNVPGGGGSDLKIKSYKTYEVNHVVWVYMGPPELEPPMPEFEWTQVPESHVFAHKRIQECNYFQIVEGEMDSSHVSFLHRRWDDLYGELTKTHPMFTDTAPKFDIVDTVYGQMVGAKRVDGDGSFYRVTQLMLPYSVLVHIVPGSFIDCSTSIPMDDENTLGVTIAWRPDRPLDEEDIKGIESGELAYCEVDPKTFIPIRNKRNDYMINREAQRTLSYSGITGVREQDSAIQEGQGLIYDRTKERLCASDAAIKALRRMMLREVRALMDGVEPVAPHRPETYRVRPTNRSIGADQNWIDAMKDELLAEGSKGIAVLEK